MIDFSPLEVWFITGSSRGFGLEWVMAALERGDKVVATARKLDSLKELFERYPTALLPLELDVTNREAVFSAIDQGFEHFGRLDVVANNAGYANSGSIEDTPAEDFRAQFEANFFGLAAMLRDALPDMRARGGGRIVNISSIGGLIGNIGSGYYNASKFAVEGLSQALALEVAPHGIRVTLVEPGPFRTDFQGRWMERAKERIGAYADTVGARRAQQDKNMGREPGDPVRAAAMGRWD